MDRPSGISRFVSNIFPNSRWSSSIVSNGGADSKPKEGKDGGEGSREKQQSRLWSQRSVPEEAEMKKVFDKFDENRDGVIGADELGRFMEKFGVPKTQQELKNIIKSVDGNSDGTIDFKEFYSLYTSLTRCDSNQSSKLSDAEEEDDNDETLREAFNVFDKDGSGTITAPELQSVLKIMGIEEGSSLKKCQQMIKSVDSNNDGVVNFQEFKKMMNSDVFKSK